MKRKKLFLVVIILIGGFCYLMSYSLNKKENIGIFLWNDEFIENEEFFSLMINNQITDIYIHVDKKQAKDNIINFIEKASDEGIRVWYLTGDPYWALDSDGERMLEEIDWVKEYNEYFSESNGFYGIIFDCEPYLLSEWDEDPEDAIKKWISASKIASNTAENNNIKYSLCIPYYLENKVNIKDLEALISTSKDEIAIMNYYKKDEIEHIRNEINLAKKYNLKTCVIYELQKPGNHGLKEVNTYYNDGISGVKESWRKIRNAYRFEDIYYAYHEYTAFQEVINNE